jgi:hypothetical protein
MTRAPNMTCCGQFRRGRVQILGLLLATTMVTVMLAPSRPARAAEPADVENLIRQGVELRQKGRDSAALPLFQRAYDLDRTPRTAAQLGLVEANMGYWLASERHLSEALASPRHPWVYKMRPQLEETLKQVRASIGEIEVVGTPSGAEVLVNGRVEGVLPLAQAIRANEGMAQVAIRAPGFEDKQTTVQVVGGKRERINVALVAGPAGLSMAGAREGSPSRARAEGSAAASKSERGRVQLGARSHADAPATDEPSSSAPTWVRPTAWVAASLAAVAVGVGVYGLVALKQKQDEFNNRPSPTKTLECNQDSPNKGSQGCKNIFNQGVAAQNLAISALGAAAVLGGAALVGFLWSADHTPSDVALASGPMASIDADGVRAGWQLRF